MILLLIIIIMIIMMMIIVIIIIIYILMNITVQKGMTLVSTNGVTANSLCVLTEGLFGYSR